MKNTEPAAVFDKWTITLIDCSSLEKKVDYPYGRINYYRIYISFLWQSLELLVRLRLYHLALRFSMKSWHRYVCWPNYQRGIASRSWRSCHGWANTKWRTFRHSSLSIISKEVWSFIGQKKDNTKMIVFLTDMFDCAEMPTKYRTKNSGSNVIPSVFVKLVSCYNTQSRWLHAYQRQR